MARPVTEPRVSGNWNPAKLSLNDGLAEPSHPRRAAEHPTFEPKDHDVGRSAEARGRADHRVEDGLDVGRGARDGPQDLGGGRLLLEGLRQLLIARLESGDEPGVLDGDQRLVGEGLQELDLLAGEGHGLGAPRHHPADGLSLAQHRHGHDVPHRPQRGEGGQPVLRIALHVRDLDDRAVQDRAADRAVSPRRARKGARVHLDGLAFETMLREQVDPLPVELEDPAELAVAEAHRALGDHVEDSLHLRRRARDRAEDLAGRGLMRQGLGELPGARVQLAEGDRGLGGEGFERGELAGRQGARRRAADGDHARGPRRRTPAAWRCRHRPGSFGRRGRRARGGRPPDREPRARRLRAAGARRVSPPGAADRPRRAGSRRRARPRGGRRPRRWRRAAPGRSGAAPLIAAASCRRVAERAQPLPAAPAAGFH